jgi:hypothetical protein
MGLLTNISGFLFGGGSTVEKSLALASEYITDPDKLNEYVTDLLKGNNAVTIPWVDALHKMGRQLMIFFLLYIYYESVKLGQPLDMSEFLMIAAGPGAYILQKGRGK